MDGNKYSILEKAIGINIYPSWTLMIWFQEGVVLLVKEL